MYAPLNPQNLDENPKYRTICGNHVTSSTKFICYLNIIGLCLSSIGSFPVGLIFTIPLIYAYYIPFKGIEEIRSRKLVPILILSGINLVTAIAVVIFCIVAFLMGELKNNFGTRFDESFIISIVFLLGIHLLWNSWCFVVILRCYQYIKDVKMGQTKGAQMI
uniref:Uncharacterized protein n=1 Tax=Panagrolaimus davidi TaxID=227884 RepID=A0A914R4F8_9BILA